MELYSILATMLVHAHSPSEGTGAQRAGFPSAGAELELTRVALNSKREPLVSATLGDFLVGKMT